MDPHISHNEKEMIMKSQRLLQYGDLDDPFEILRNLLLARGFSGLLGFGRCFREMDDEGKRILNRHHFNEAIHYSGVELPDGLTCDDLFNRIDVNDRGIIDASDFLAAIRPPMSESRKKIVDAAFNKMDKDNAGFITMDILKHFYNVKSNPRYVSGVQSEETILKKFIDHFEENNHVDGEITKDDFDNYYAALSASVEDDTYFDLVIRQVYKL